MRGYWYLSARRLVALLLMVLVTTGGAGCGKDDKGFDYPPPPETGEVQANTYALLVGCNQYPHLAASNRLYGPANDVEFFRVTLRDYLFVPDANITVLSDAGDEEHLPKSDNIKRELKRLRKIAKPGDRMIFQFAGHGYQIRDNLGGAGPAANNDLEADSQDEFMLPRDQLTLKRGEKKLKNAIRDDYMRDWSTGVRDKGATVWMIFDCCHSGSMSRGPGLRMRTVMPEDLGVTDELVSTDAATPASAGKRAVPVDMTRIVGFYACQAFELAPEKSFPESGEDRVCHGVMTLALSLAIRKCGPEATFEALERYMVEEARKIPDVMVTPWAEGDTKLRVGRKGEGGPLLMVTKNKNTGALRLNAGRLRGFQVGTELTAYERKGLGKPESIVGRVKITDAGLAESKYEVIEVIKVTESDEDRSLEGLPMEVSLAVLGDMRIPLFICDAWRTALAPEQYPQDLKAAFKDEDLSGRFILAPRRSAQWILQQEGTGWFLESTAAGKEVYRITFAGGVKALQSALENMARTQSLLGLVNSEDLAGKLPKDLYVEAIVEGRAGGTDEESLALAKMLRLTDETSEISFLKSGESLSPGESIALRYRNQTGEAMDVTVLEISARQGIKVMLPEKETTARLAYTDVKAGEQVVGGLSDQVFGPEYLLVLAVPRKRDDDVISFSHLKSDPIKERELLNANSRGHAGSALAKLLGQRAFGGATSRGASADPEGLCVKLIRYRTKTWDLELPEAYKVGAYKVARTIPPQAGPAAAGAPPKPWFLGTHLCVAPDIGGKKTYPAVITWNDDATYIYIDTDDNAGIEAGNEEALAGLIASGTLDVELVARVGAGKRMAWYAPDRGDFTVVTEPATNPEGKYISDGTYIRHERLGDQSWSATSLSGTWLTSGHLPGSRESRIVFRLHALRKR